MSPASSSRKGTTADNLEKRPGLINLIKNEETNIQFAPLPYLCTQKRTTFTKMKNILSLNHKEAMDFFMQTEQFHGFELPEYITFDKMLAYVKQRIGDTPYEECIKEDTPPETLSDVNLDLLMNKDGKYAVRPLILANPYLYYFLVRELCSKEGWKTVKGCFQRFQVPHITACALPVITDRKEKFYKSNTILHWWNSFEQRSVELSLEYRFMFSSDITNCYGSVNPQSFNLAFGVTDTTEAAKDNLAISAHIQQLLRAFQQGRNIGIPQGSAIFDFLAEILLGYADLRLHQAIDAEGINVPYEVLRYRDDYRIFCNDKDQLERISYLLQGVLESLNFRMNSQKTKISQSIVTDAIKADKLFYIYNTPIFNKKGTDFDSFEKHLLFILQFGRQYPNSGQLKTLLNDLDERMEQYLEKQKAEKGVEVHFDIDGENLRQEQGKEQEQHTFLPGGSVRAMAAVAVQIALENVTVCHYVLRVVSRMLETLDNEKEKRDIIVLMRQRLINYPNSKYNQLWLQNITYKYDKRKGQCPYDMRLCRLVAGEGDVVLWNNDWLKEPFTKDIPYASCVNKQVLRKITPIIMFRERRAYDEAMALGGER